MSNWIGKARGYFEESFGPGANHTKELSVQMWAVEVHTSRSYCTADKKWTYCAGLYIIWVSTCNWLEFISDVDNF
jgi:hypothetical protein